MAVARLARRAMINRMSLKPEDDQIAGVDGRAVAREIGAAPELEEVIDQLLGLGVSADAIRRAHERGRWGPPGGRDAADRPRLRAAGT